MLLQKSCGVAQQSLTRRATPASARPQSLPTQIPRCVQPEQQRGSRCRTQAYLEPQAVVAISQQAAAYAAVLGGDLYWERRSKLPPKVPVNLVGIAGNVAAIAILNSGQSSLEGIGMVGGLLTAGALLAYHTKRAVEIEDEDADWPGPKVAPGTIALISFFQLCVYIQGIKSEL